MDTEKLKEYGHKMVDLYSKYPGLLMAASAYASVELLHSYSLYRLASCELALKSARKAHIKFSIKKELTKPFFQKLYEMSGRGY